MKKNYAITLFTLLLGISLSAQTVLFEQLVDGTSGIISDDIAGVGTYSADDFVLDDSYIIETIFAPGFGSNGSDISANMTGLDVYIYTDAAGLPSSDPSTPGTGVLEIIDLSPTDPALTISNNELTIDVTAAVGSDVILGAGTYWLVVAPRVPTDAVRWNWFQSSAGGNAHLIDEGNFGGLPWTDFTSLGLTFDSLAFTISGSPDLSVEDETLNSVSVYPNPAKNVINIENVTDLTSVELYSVIGKQVYKGANETSIDISNLNDGVYLLKLTNETGSITKRIVKQ